MRGRFHIYLIQSSPMNSCIESRSLCPECAKNPSKHVQEIYERDGGSICMACGITPIEVERRAVKSENVLPNFAVK